MMQLSFNVWLVLFFVIDVVGIDGVGKSTYVIFVTKNELTPSEELDPTIDDFYLLPRPLFLPLPIQVLTSAAILVLFS